MIVNPNHLDEVRQVLERNKERILREYHAAGAGIGKVHIADPGYVITVYLVSGADRPAEPVQVEGVQLQFQVTGEISAY